MLNGNEGTFAIRDETYESQIERSLMQSIWGQNY